MKKYLSAIIFILSLIALVISLRLFSNLGIYVDEHNTSPSVVLGGDFYLFTNWLRLLLLALITAGSGLQLFLERNKE